MLLATFVIAPTYALSAGENAGGSATSTEKVEGAKAGSTKSDVEQQQPDQSESNNNTEPNKKNTGSSSTLTNNKESKSVEKQNSDSNKVDDKAKSTDSDVKKNAKDAQKKDASAKAANGTGRSVTEEPQLPEECRKAGMDKLAKCYVAKYEFKYKNKYVSYANITKPDESYTGEPKFYRVTKLSNNGDPSKLINVSYDEVKGFVKSFSLEGIVVDEKLLDSKEETNKFVEVDSTSGAVTIRPNNWLKKGYYDVYVKVEYKDGSALTHLESCTEQSKCKVKAKGYEEYLQFRVKIRYNDTKNNNVLSLKVYNHQKAEGRTEVDDVPFTLNKDGKFNPSTIFIDSQSSGKFNRIYHRMICHKDSDSDYYLNSINNDLTLSDSDVSGSAKSSTQKQWEHRLGNRTSGSVLNDFTSGELYENDGDSIGERSQSWITGTPKVGSEGKYTCRVFAINDANFSAGKVVSESYVDLFDSNAKDKSKLKSAFDNPMDAFGNNKESLSKKKGIDWDYKTITIQFGDELPKIGDNDLTLKVYPFKDSTTALTSDNNKISAILGMSLKPFVDATSAADSANKITLRVLCSKGEKKDSGSRSEQPSEPSQPSQTAGSPQAEESLVYKTWSSNLAELGLSVPADDNQNTCHSNKEGEKTCVSADPKTNVAARTDMEVSIKPTEVGNYQCVVFALKPKALETFDGLKGSLTPTSIKSSLTAAPASFKEHKDFAAFTLNIHLVSNFTLPHTGGQSCNLQLGILAALLVNLLAAGFVVSQSERGRKLIFGRWRGLCNYV
ncbi:Rib/alpha-like domain-containing protein [Gardnerella sp. Marseille-Q9179]|uniref:Rib/alpha-like domain-containing protein n=1 Tax=Gardnerella sp. Marseille-Q9179 TaxID=3383028 RepID=UPI003AF9AE88